MARIKSKWKLFVFCYLVFINVFVKSLPVKRPVLENNDVVTSDTIFRNAEVPHVEDLLSQVSEDTKDTNTDAAEAVVTVNEGNFTVFNLTRNVTPRNLVPGQEIRQYAVQITLDDNSFRGRLVIDVVLSTETREEPIRLLVDDLDIQSVMVGVFTEANAVPVDVNFGPLIDGVDERNSLIIEPPIPASSYIVIVEYEGPLTNSGRGLYKGVYGDVDYIGMNLHPTSARRVFPCLDEPTQASTISFTFENVNYNNLVSNSMLEENSQNQFRALQGPPHLWSMVAHSFTTVAVTLSNVLIYARPGVINQDNMASIAINNFFTKLNEWTEKPYFEIMFNQNPELSIMALPDVSRDWYGLTTIGIWEPYILMENTCSRKQRFKALLTIAEALAKQWFGYVIYPENYRYEWVVSGLAKYAAYDILRQFHSENILTDSEALDINTLFVTEVIQESLLLDSYRSVGLVEPTDNLIYENEIRDNIYGIQKTKATSILRMLRIILGEDQDFVQLAAKTLITGRALQTVNGLHFIDAMNSNLMMSGNNAIDDLEEFLRPYFTTSGYPILTVSWTQLGASVSLERFSFSPQGGAVEFVVPLTYSISNSPNFEDPQVYNYELIGGAYQVSAFLDEGDYILFNIQGQGYYRVFYDSIMWERIIEALYDPDRRNEIHPLNRATLLDDVMVLARGGRVDYETALIVALSWEHETEYAPWKAFVRNMNFLRKQLVAYVTFDEELDPDIYLRMVRRTIGTFEQEVGFSPDPTLLEPAMTSLTRGLVMDHACRSNYEPCIAAALDWFYDNNANEPTVNPNIPYDIRPAVYCAMVQHSNDDDVIAALNERLEIEPSMYERVVILESFGCSQDLDFIDQLLVDTISADSPYSVEERVKIFKAVTEGGFENAWRAFDFLRFNTEAIRNSYGSPEKFEEILQSLAENLVDRERLDSFENLIFNQNNNLDDSQQLAERYLGYANEDLNWQEIYLNVVYEWIDENDAPTLMVSFLLITISCFIALFNH